MAKSLVRECYPINYSISISVEVTITVEDAYALDEEKGWEVFRRMGQNAVAGKLSDASRKHDEYLYGKIKRKTR